MKKSTVALLLVASMSAQYASASDWFIRVGASSVNPKSDTGKLAGLDSSMSSNTQLGLTAGYFFMPNMAVELLASTPFTHDVSLAGLGKVGETKHLPPTLSVQYYFNAEGKVSPFVGAGLNYTWTFVDKATGPLTGHQLKVGNSFGLAAQAGLRFALSNKWDIVADARWMDIDADVRLNGADIGTATVDPMVYSIMLGKRF